MHALPLLHPPQAQSGKAAIIKGYMRDFKRGSTGKNIITNK